MFCTKDPENRRHIEEKSERVEAIEQIGEGETEQKKLISNNNNNNNKTPKICKERKTYKKSDETSRSHLKANKMMTTAISMMSSMNIMSSNEREIYWNTLCERDNNYNNKMWNKRERQRAKRLSNID